MSSIEHFMAYFTVLNKTLLFFPLSQMSFNKENTKLVMGYKNFNQGKTNWELCIFFKAFNFVIIMVLWIRLDY